MHIALSHNPRKNHMMQQLIEIASAAGVISIFVLASTIKSIKGGYLGNLLQKYTKESKKTNNKLDEIQEKIDETYEQSSDNGEQIEDLGEAIFLLHHEDNNIDESELREKVGVSETATDIFDDD